MIDEADTTQLDFLDSRLLLQSWQLRKISFWIFKWTAFDEEVIEGERINMRHQGVILKHLAFHSITALQKALLQMCLGTLPKQLHSCAGVLTWGSCSLPVSESMTRNWSSLKPEEGALLLWFSVYKLQTKCSLLNICIHFARASILLAKTYFQTSRRSFPFHVSQDRG